MTKLKYTLKNDVLFKMMFVEYPELLKNLVAQILSIQPESIGQFVITNSEIPPDAISEKFCRLDINMTVDGQRVDLEIQVDDRGDYTERALYYWAREYSSGLAEGEKYRDLPRAIIISIIAFEKFDCAEYRSEFQTLEVRRHTPLNDKMCLLFFELPKLPTVTGADDKLESWLTLFSAETEEEIATIKSWGDPIMEQAIDAYRHVVATDKFKELERLRSLARHNEASALDHARREAEKAEREKWQSVVAKKDMALADKDAALAELRLQLAALKTKAVDKA